jgi:hypothetical protein
LILNHTTGLLAKTRHRACPKNYISGFWHKAAQDSFDINVYPGTCRDTNDQFDIVFPTKMTKKSNALWSLGNNNGGLDVAWTVEAYYAIHAILNPATGATDLLLSKSFATPALPSGFTVFRRVGGCWIGGANKLAGHRFQDDYLAWFPAVTNMNDGQATTGQSGNMTVSVPASVLGVGTRGRFNATAYASGGGGILSLGSTIQSGVTMLVSPSTNWWGAGAMVDLMVDGNDQISWAIGVVSGILHFNVYCQGFFDFRNKDGPVISDF